MDFCLANSPPVTLSESPIAVKSYTKRILVLIVGLGFHPAGIVGLFLPDPAGRAVPAGGLDHPVVGICLGPSPVEPAARAFSEAWSHRGPGHREGDGMVTADFWSTQNGLMLIASGANLEAANPCTMADPVISAALAPAGRHSIPRPRCVSISPEIWMRFLLALLGLVLAFAAALFSTVARESGSLWAHSHPGFDRAVPGGRGGPDHGAVSGAPGGGRPGPRCLQLRRDQGRNHLRSDRSSHRRGGPEHRQQPALRDCGGDAGRHPGIGRGLGDRACAIWSWIFVCPIRFLRALPRWERSCVRNRRSWLPSFSISVVPLKPKPSRAVAVGAHDLWFSARTARRQTVGTTARTASCAGSPAVPPLRRASFTESAYFPYIPAAAELAAELELCFPRRGRYQQNSFGLATRFPFAFLTKTRRVSPWPAEMLVYPPVETTDEFFEVLPLIAGEFESFARGQGDDLYLIREYMPEDSARHVDWKATAKSGSLKVREFSRAGRTQAAPGF